MSLDATLLDILACPDTHHAPLTYDEGAATLTCSECGRVFPIRDGIPVLLLDEAIGGPAAGSSPPDEALASDAGVAPASAGDAAQEESG